MALLVTLRAKFKALSVLIVGVIMAVMATGCGSGVDDYTGTWMGIDETGRGLSKVYQYDIAISENGTDYTIRVTQSDYQVSLNHSSANWRSTMPHYFTAQMNSDGDLVSDIGVIRADPNNFRLVYGNIYLVRKAKNTEAKFKYVARKEIEQLYPGIVVND